MARRADLPKELHNREATLREVMPMLVALFPGSGIIRALREQADRLEAGTDDTAGREC